MTRLGHPVQNLAAAVLVGGEIHTHCFEECGVYVCVYVRVCVICRLNHCTLSGTMLISRNAYLNRCPPYNTVTNKHPNGQMPQYYSM